MRLVAWGCACAVAVAGVAWGDEPQPKKAPPPPAGTEKAEPGYIGVQAAPIDPEDRADHGLKEGQAGVLLLEVTEKGPADLAGVKAGDVLLAVDGKPVATPEALGPVVRGLRPGSEAPFELLRDGKPQTVAVNVGTAPQRQDGEPDEKAIAQMKQQQAAMLAMLPPEMRAKVEALQKQMEEKSKKLKEKYKADGVPPNEMRRRMQEALMADEEIRQLMEEVQKMGEAMQGGGGPGR